MLSFIAPPHFSGHSSSTRFSGSNPTATAAARFAATDHIQFSAAKELNPSKQQLKINQGFEKIIAYYVTAAKHFNTLAEKKDQLTKEETKRLEGFLHYRNYGTTHNVENYDPNKKELWSLNALLHALNEWRSASQYSNNTDDEEYVKQRSQFLLNAALAAVGSLPMDKINQLPVEEVDALKRPKFVDQLEHMPKPTSLDKELGTIFEDWRKAILSEGYLEYSIEFNNKVIEQALKFNEILNSRLDAQRAKPRTQVEF